MNKSYVFVGEKRIEILQNPILKHFNQITDETRPMKVEIEVRKFWLWRKL